MTITQLSIKRPILIIVFFVIVGLLGAFAVSQLNYELLPKIDAPFVSITAGYEGASPAEIENTITKKIEDGVAGVSRVKRITSRSNEGYAVISLEFLQGTDLDEATQETQRFVNQVVSQLPAGVKPPTVDKFSLADLPVLRLAATSNLPNQDFYQLLKDQLKPRLAQLKGVGRVQLQGGQEREIKVYLEAEKLKFHQLPVLAVVQALQKANLEVPLGQVKDQDAQFGVRLSGKFSELATLANLDVAVLADGSKVRLRDVARLEQGLKEGRTVTRLNGQEAVGLLVQKQANANAVEVSALVRAEIAKLEQEYQAEKLAFEVANDSSEFTLKATKTVFFDLMLAIFLVALVMLVFLHSLRNALIVMLAIPASLVFAFIGMLAFGFSLNLMTLLAMSLVIGILVDDSIVVLENIYRHLEMGKDRVTASLDGRNEIGFSALSITLVDVVVFLPLAFVPGITGGLVKEFALVIVVSTLASLLVCFTLTPLLASRFARLEHLSGKNLFGKLILGIEKLIQKLINEYVNWLKVSLQHRWLVYALAFGSLVASLGLVTGGYVGGEFVPTTDKGEISVVVETPAGSKLEQTEALARRLEQQMRQLPEVKRVFSTVGAANDPFFGETLGDNQLEFAVLLVDKTQRQKTVAEMSHLIRNQLLAEPGVQVKVSPVGLIGAEATPIQVLISGTDRAQMLTYAQQIKQLTAKIDGADDVRLSIQSGKTELNLQVDRERLASLGLPLDEVATSLRVALTGLDDLKFRQGSTEFPLRVQLQPTDRQRTEQLGNLGLVSAQGQLVYLKQVAKVERSHAPAALERRNKNASIMLLAKVVGKSVNQVGEDLKQVVAQNPPPAGIRVSYEGDLELADNSFLYLGLALVAGLTLVYLIMVALYNSFLYPFVVLFSIPVALTGALLALALTMKTLNVFSIFGLIMMLGLVAKNAILLVDRTNEMRAEGLDTRAALLDAGQTRLRPILMTTLAMVIGMVPLALQTGAGGEYNSALAWVLIGGLTSSLVFTVFVVPAIYLELDNLLKKFNKKDVQNQPVGKVAATLGLALLLASGAAAQTPLGLAEVENRARQHNPEVLIGQTDVARAEWGIREARGLYLPTVGLAGQYNRNLQPQVFFLPANFFDPTADPNTFQSVNASAKNVYQANLSWSLPLLQWENGPNLANAKLGRQNAELGQQQLVIRKVTEARKAYFDALWAKAQAEFWQESQERQGQLLAEARQRFRVGLLGEADTLQAFVQAENVRPQVLKAQNAYLVAEQQLKLLLDLPAEQAVQLTGQLALVLQPAPDEANLPQRPDLQQLQLQTRSLLHQEKLEQARRLPNLQLVGQYSLLTQSEDFQFNQYRWVRPHLIGLQLNVPIFSGFRHSSRVQQVRLQQQQAQQTYQLALKQAQVEVRTLASQLRDVAAQLRAQAGVVQAAERSYRLFRDRWQQGLAKLGELRDNELALQEAKLNHLGLVYQHLLLQNELNRAAGQ